MGNILSYDFLISLYIVMYFFILNFNDKYLNYLGITYQFNRLVYQNKNITFK